MMVPTPGFPRFCQQPSRFELCSAATCCSSMGRQKETSHVVLAVITSPALQSDCSVTVTCSCSQGDGFEIPGCLYLSGVSEKL